MVPPPRFILRLGLVVWRLGPIKTIYTILGLKSANPNPNQLSLSTVISQKVDPRKNDSAENDRFKPIPYGFLQGMTAGNHPLWVFLLRESASGSTPQPPGLAHSHSHAALSLAGPSPPGGLCATPGGPGTAPGEPGASPRRFLLRALSDLGLTSWPVFFWWIKYLSRNAHPHKQGEKVDIQLLVRCVCVCALCEPH